MSSQCRDAPKPPRQPSSGRLAARWIRLLPAVLLAPGCGLAAALDLTVDGGVQRESNSNVFALAPGQPTTLRTGDPKRGDSYESYGGSLTATYLLSRQSLTLNIDGHEYRYEHYGELNHSEYRLKGIWNWKVSRLVDGALEVNRHRQMVPYYNYAGTLTNFGVVPPQTSRSQLSLQTDQVERASINIHMTPNWALATGGSSSQSDSPRPGLPSLSLKENSAEVAVKYTRGNGWNGSVSTQYTDGKYTGAGVLGAPTYSQYHGQFSAAYSRNPASTIDFAAGYSKRRSSDGFDNNHGFVGFLGYDRKLSAKTTMKLELSRSLNSYISTAGSELDTAASASLSWSATHKVSITAGYSYTYSQLPQQGFGAGDRIDHFRTAKASLDYRPFKWLYIQPYARWETRTSDFQFAQYSTDVYGIAFAARWQNKNTNSQ
jgi:hypothetical protein